MAEEGKDGEKKDQKPKRDLGKILAIGFVVLNFLVIGGGGFLAYQATLGHHRTPVTEESVTAELKNSPFAEDQPILYTLEPIVVNLDGRPKRTMRTILTIEMLDPKGFEEIVDMDAATRDSIVNLLGSKNFLELESVQGKLFLKDEIATILNRKLTDGVVKDIYFSEFVVQ